MRSKRAKKFARETVRPIYRTFLFACIAAVALWGGINSDPSGFVHSRIGSVSHPHSPRGRRLVSTSSRANPTDDLCNVTGCELASETECTAVAHCKWYKVLNVCEPTTANCGDASLTNFSECIEYCPTYNWTVRDVSTNASVIVDDVADLDFVQTTCNSSNYDCFCDGEETQANHSECLHEFFGVPDSLYDLPLHSIWVLVVVVYGFIGIAIVCDTYFEPSLETISTKLKLSPDVAGATFMAMGSSAPELFTSLSDNFITKNNVGVGTIVGSALFNILVIVALSAVVARPRKGEPDTKNGIKVDWRPVLRDVIFYAGSIGLLILFIIDESVFWWESLIMILAYALYIVYMTQNKKIIAACDRAASNKPRQAAVAPMTAVTVKSVDGPKSEALNTEGNSKVAEKEKTDIESSGETKEGDAAATEGDAKAETSTDGADGGDGGGDDNDDDDDDDDDDDWRVWPNKEEWGEMSCGAKSWFIFVAPLHALFYITIPNCANPNPVLQSLYPLTFVNCVLWMAVLCALETTLVTWLGCWWGISAPVMGIVILAIGTSVPDAIASMIVARGGQGDMAIANAVGSNVFDILFGLGLPWLIADLVFQVCCCNCASRRRSTRVLTSAPCSCRPKNVGSSLVFSLMWMASWAQPSCCMAPSYST